jgi:hypothetical protein
MSQITARKKRHLEYGIANDKRNKSNTSQSTKFDEQKTTTASTGSLLGQSNTRKVSGVAAPKTVELVTALIENQQGNGGSTKTIATLRVSGDTDCLTKKRKGGGDRWSASRVEPGSVGGETKYIDLGYSGVIVDLDANNGTTGTYFLLPGPKHKTVRYKCWLKGCLSSPKEMKLWRESGGMGRHLQNIHTLKYNKKTIHTGVTLSSDLDKHMQTCRRLSPQDFEAVQQLAQQRAEKM